MRAGWLALALAACSPAGTKDSSMSTPPKSTSAPSTPSTAPTAADGARTPIAHTRDDLEKYEGTLVQIEGTFRFPTKQAFARNELVLDDGTVVVLPRPSSGTGAAELIAANDGARLAVRGLVYVNEIPAKYDIIGRTPDPYMVELVAVERMQ